MAGHSNLYTIAPALLTQSTALRLGRDSGAVVNPIDIARGIEPRRGNTARPAIVSECYAQHHDIIATSLPESAQVPWLRTIGGRSFEGLDHAVQWAYIGYQAAGEKLASHPPHVAHPSFAARLTGVFYAHERGVASTTTQKQPPQPMQNGNPLWQPQTQPPQPIQNSMFNDSRPLIGLKPPVSPLSACVNLPNRLTEKASKELLQDSPWQPGGEAHDANIFGCALQYVSSLERTREVCDELYSSGTDEDKRNDDAWLFAHADDLPNSDALRCPFLQHDFMHEPPQGAISKSLTNLHCVATVAGYTTNETDFVTRGVRGEGGTDPYPPKPENWNEMLFLESAGWPRPPTCAWRTSSRMNFRARRAASNGGSRLVKHVNRLRSLEYRPILKSGSTFFGNLLGCIQPGEWSTVPESTRMPKGYTAIIVVREPFRRFTSALSEIMRRVFTGMCPGGPCKSRRDWYFTSGVHDSADEIARHSSWFRHALKLNGGEVDASERNRTVADLLTAAVTDTSCVLSYYGAEHFMSQMQLAATQGTDLNTAKPVERARILRLEDVGTGVEAMMASPFLEAIGAQGVPRQQLERCIAEAHASEHHHAPPRNSTHASHESGGGGSADAVSVSSGSRALPDEEELYTMLMASPALLISLCHTYAQDTACLASQYEPPAVCQELLAPNGGRGAPLAPESEWLFAPDWEPIRRAGYRAA